MAWSKYASVTTDHTQCGSSDSTNITILQSFTDANLKTVANGGLVTNANGFDIAKAVDNAAATLQTWEQEFYDGVAGKWIAWQLYSSLSHTVDETDYLFSGNSSITTFQGGATGAAWDANSKAVYHFPDGTTLGINDSTSNANTLFVSNSGTPGATAGNIDGGASFNGSNTCLSHNSFVLGGSGSLTIECWAKSSTMTSQSGMLLEKSNVNAEWEIFVSGGSLILRGGGLTAVTASAPSNSAWHHIAGVIAGTSGTIYIDGVSAATGSVDAIVNNTSQLNIGCYDANGFVFSGTLDEAKVSNVGRSADWLAQEFNNQKSSSTFLTLGSWLTPGGSSRGLFLPPKLDGLGSGGSFFGDRLAA